MSEATAPKLPPLRSAVMGAFLPMDEDFGFLSFSAIAVRADIDHKHARRTTRALARMGLLEYKSGLWTEDGRPYGSGYGLTDAGRSYLANAESPTPLSAGEG